MSNPSAFVTHGIAHAQRALAAASVGCIALRLMHPTLAQFKFTIIDRANPGSALDIAEHNFIQELTGGVAARRSSAVSNLRDPVGAARRPTFRLPEPK